VQVAPITVLKSEFRKELINQIAVSDTYICYALKNGSLRVLHRSTASRALLRGHTSSITDLAFFGPDDSFLASSDKAGTVMVRKIVEAPDAPSEVLLFQATLPELAGSNIKLAWYPIDPTVLAFAANGTLFLAVIEAFSDAPTVSTAPLFQMPLGSAGMVTCLAFSPNGQLVAVADDSGAVQTWRVGNKEAGSIIDQGSAVSFRPYGAQPAATARFLPCSSFPRPVLVTGDATNRTLQLWALQEAGQPELLQTVQLDCAGGFFSHACVVGQHGLLLLANTARSQVHALHISETAASVAFDYLASFTVAQPILSCTAVLEPAGGRPAVQLYCIQTEAIQQYTVDPEACAPLEADEAPALALVQEAPAANGVAAAAAPQQPAPEAEAPAAAAPAGGPEPHLTAFEQLAAPPPPPMPTLLSALSIGSTASSAAQQAADDERPAASSSTGAAEMVAGSSTPAEGQPATASSSAAAAGPATAEEQEEEEDDDDSAAPPMLTPAQLIFGVQVAGPSAEAAPALPSIMPKSLLSHPTSTSSSVSGTPKAGSSSAGTPTDLTAAVPAAAAAPAAAALPEVPEAPEEEAPASSPAAPPPAAAPAAAAPAPAAAVSQPPRPGIGQSLLGMLKRSSAKAGSGPQPQPAAEPAYSSLSSIDSAAAPAALTSEQLESIRAPAMPTTAAADAGVSSAQLQELLAGQKAILKQLQLQADRKDPAELVKAELAKQVGAGARGGGGRGVVGTALRTACSRRRGAPGNPQPWRGSVRL
jgi:hypothetical protein